jgi:phage shock protein PspC (stress-responsive transcriptional regulator)
MKKLYRSRNDRVISGVCGGIGAYFDIDPVMIRIIAVLLLVFGGGGLLAYLIAILIIPLEPITAKQEVKTKVEKGTPSPEYLNMEKHVQFLGGLYIIFNSLTLVVAIIVSALVAGGGFISGDETVIAITGIVASALAIFLLVISAPGIICGFGLLKHRPWARVLALIIGVINLINIPFGTALGIYTLWVLMNEDSQPLFGSTAD